ncbi:hypothetical protein Pan216_31420 [Planctomycetes bacterium Pan216]|uniref:Uncharacterized protein n=1 Tax=Kolteria novifilia TaxID=2527975 RepID=A0A518B5M7_9BACT|nr:hypothetical protein Pan216_31420 [Planctomycetes bacterium Pan216]
MYLKGCLLRRYTDRPGQLTTGNPRRDQKASHRRTTGAVGEAPTRSAHSEIVDQVNLVGWVVLLPLRQGLAILLHVEVIAAVRVG